MVFLTLQCVCVCVIHHSFIQARRSRVVNLTMLVCIIYLSRLIDCCFSHAVSDDDQYCSNQEGTQAYPSDLTFFVPPISPSQEDPTDDNGARPITALSPLLVLLMATALRYIV